MESDLKALRVKQVARIVRDRLLWLREELNGALADLELVLVEEGRAPLALDAATLSIDRIQAIAYDCHSELRKVAP